MSKRYVNAAIGYALLAMAGGVFFREYTRAIGFDGTTALSVVHTHYFVMGMAMFLLLALLEKSFGFSEGKGVAAWVGVYHAGLNVTVAGLVLRGLADTRPEALPAALDGALSGVSELGHIALGVSLIVILLRVRASLIRSK